MTQYVPCHFELPPLPETSEIKYARNQIHYVDWRVCLLLGERIDRYGLAMAMGVLLEISLVLAQNRHEPQVFTVIKNRHLDLTSSEDVLTRIFERFEIRDRSSLWISESDLVRISLTVAGL